ncbi:MULTISPECIES: alpha-hydroxy acid oxidase [unclassified Mesorhizobium]|uniref:alpha-hydroxy acid oxidase n=1 Tax=unclassified Mesorhizobium TaxID=325217 RepID=UPI000FD80EC3|nr:MULTISPECIES: alpha-hydroxy acid oxidase [unclassified Mesorhizobium]TGQ11702.1 alpha-hydroxy-acid oxidizing protein [Mesorhizobium sp. M2E.F.Ca.ET.219.01.1.1]TGT70339.1 alpha-hydroxy-acid oxidizing protein [Mesorhizobium sp. M2E.F.Ca.ET.166.01.1.1]TGV98573.1 alpha-hydroxy-acid oxidizing protein [Mesorhizobium sp. M2E.F.Ca.ET.154.01.1.1]
MNSNTITCIEDLRQLHRKRVPRAFFDYADRGSYSEQTLRENRTDFEKIKFRQRVLVDVSRRNTSTVLLGEAISVPLVLAPVGLGGLQYADGEIHACRAAQTAGIPYTLSIMSICSMEDVAAAVKKPFWFQLSLLKDRGFVRSLVERAIAVKCDAIVLTVDLPVLAQRHADIKNGMTVPPKWTFGKFVDFASRPAWVASVMRGKRKTFGNLVGQSGNQKIESLAAWMNEQFGTSPTLKDVEWVRSIWPGKLIVKGIGDAKDARDLAKIGVQGLVVSNHGGRQLDGGRSTISVLPEIADAVGADLEVLVDGGVRSGQDVMRALALGAKACMIGRAYVHGLGAAGEQGVAKAIDLIRKEFDVTMGLTGTVRVDEIDRRILA